MVFALRKIVLVAGAAFALPVLAQGVAYSPATMQAAVYAPSAIPAFPPAVAGADEQRRTAELLASSQMRKTGYSDGRMENQMLVTRRVNSEDTYAKARPVPPPSGYTMSDARVDAYAPPPPAGYAQAAAYPVPAPSYQVAAAPVPMAAPASAAYANSYNTAADASSIPAMPNARPGECFALVRIPEQFRSYQKEYELRAASERLETVPPRYENVTEQYVVAEAFERLEVVPATFKNVTETVEIAPPSSRYVSTEPVYETLTETVLEQPARTVWKRGNGPIQRMDNATGEIMCLVEEPAVYKNVTRRVLKTPAEVKEVPIPGQSGTVTRRVIERPAEVRRVVVPEQIGTRTVRKLAEPGQVRRIPIPAQTGSTTVRELVAPARLEWRPVLCETNMTPDVIRRVQESLAAAGFSPGPINGRMGPETVNALNRYQRSRSLPEDRYLNMETVRSLGVM